MLNGTWTRLLQSSATPKTERLAFDYQSRWEQRLRDLLSQRSYTLEDVQGRIYDSSGRPVDILYLGMLTAEHFPLQIELPDLGHGVTQGSQMQLKLEFSLDYVGGKEVPDTSYFPMMTGSRLTGRRRSLRRSQSQESLVNNVGRVLRVYVQALCNGQTRKTPVSEVEQGDSVSFTEEAGLFFELRRGSGGPKKASELLSAVRIAVYDKRSSWIRGDALLGEQYLYLPSEVIFGKPMKQTLRLQRRSIDIDTQVTVKYTLLTLEDAKATLASSTRFSLLQNARALVQLLQVPGGVALLLKARPQGIKPVTKEEIYVELQRLQERLAEPWAESEEELCLEHMSAIARQLLDFVELRAEPHADIPKLIVDWMLHLSAQVPIRGSVRGTSTREAFASETRLRRFLESAQLRLEGLVPMDAEGSLDMEWKREALSLREIGNWHFALMHIPETAVLGRGSFGTVWRAKDAHTGRSYAVKNVTVPPRGFAKAAQRESDVADRLSKEPHRCVVQLYHAKHFPDLRMYAFVMELCTRGSLTDHIRELRLGAETYEAPSEAFSWIGQILLGMEHLHSMGMLVRDLKADNVVLTDGGRGLLAKLTDFGLCRFGTEATGDWTFGAPPGTPAYIAPEVIRGQSYGRAADLYSFGALIWLVLTGGLVAEGEPKIEPPCAQMAHKWDYSALAQNFKLIAACIQQPEENGARPLPSAEAEELVLDLTKEEATGRPSLEELRRYPALQPLRLPDPKAGTKEVDAWLACLAQRGCLSCGGQGCGLCRLDDSVSQGQDVTSDDVSQRRAQASEDVPPTEELEATASAGGQPELEKTRPSLQMTERAW